LPNSRRLDGAGLPDRIWTQVLSDESI